MKRLTIFTIAVAASLTACGSASETTTSAAAPAAASSAAATVTLAPGTKVNANTATEDQLRTIPGVGEKIADEIMEYRPYDATTGPDKFKKELAKYIPAGDIDKIMGYLDFS